MMNFNVVGGGAAEEAWGKEITSKTNLDLFWTQKKDKSPVLNDQSRELRVHNSVKYQLIYVSPVSLNMWRVTVPIIQIKY